MGSEPLHQGASVHAGSPPARVPHAGPEVSQSTAERSKGKELLAAAFYHSGALRLLEGFIRTHELRSAAHGGFPRWHRARDPRFAILCYHRVGTQGLPLYSYLPPEQFAAQMRFIRERYRVVSLEQLCAELESPESRVPSVAVTFDDGYRDVYTHAFPILQAYRVPATVYATAGAIEGGQVPWYDRVFLALQVMPGKQLELPLDRPRCYSLSSPGERYRAALDVVAQLRCLSNRRREEVGAILESQITLPSDELAGRMLTWEELRTMHRAGIAIGSHTMTHPVVSQLSPAELEEELSGSKRLLENRLDAPVRDFAFPFGQPADCGTSAAASLARWGYRSAATTCWGINRPWTSPFSLRRVQIGEGCSLAMFAFQLGRLFVHTDEDGATRSSQSVSLQPRPHDGHSLPPGSKG